MLSSRWHKVLNDLWGNKTRTILIVLSIGVGLFAVGTIVSARSILATEMARSFAAIKPGSGTVRTVQPFDEGFVRSVRSMPEVEDADARRAIDVRVQIGPGEWHSLRVFAIQDYSHIRVNKVLPESGAWPPPEREILIERAALPLIQAEVGDVILIETPDEKQRQLRIAGLAHDPAQVPAQFSDSIYGYISFETLDWFGEDYGFNELYVVAKNADDKEHAQYVNNQVKSKAERNGLTIPYSTTPAPGELPLDDILQAILMIMGALGLLSLFLSMFLIVNTVSALLAQQKRLIGVMKAIGARTKQILGMYLGMVIIYGLIALVIAVPLGVIGSRALSRFMAGMFNFDLTELSVPPQAVLLQVAVGLLVPVLASLYPFFANLQVTAAEAMSGYQMGKGRFGAGILDRLLSGANLWFARRVLFRPLLLSVRNIFRSKGRLALTLITLTLAGATFIGVFSVSASLDQATDDIMRLWNFDTLIIFRQPYRIEKIERAAGQVPGVVQTDIWLQLVGRRVREDGSESGPIYMFAPRADSELAASPMIVEGRWLLPGDHNALVVNATLLKDEPDVAVGREMVLKIDGRERNFQVVGISVGGLAPFAYANYDYIAQITGNTGRADTALVATADHDQAYVAQATKDLEAHFDRIGMRVSTVQTAMAERSQTETNFSLITSLLLVMAALLALVGGLGLAGTMGINVLERTREIGVLRAIGAPNQGVATVFIREGIAIGVLSWTLGALLAFPLGKGLSDAVGTMIMGVPMSFSYSIPGVWFWLAVVVVLSAVASSLPARNASRLTVREVLAYE